MTRLFSMVLSLLLSAAALTAAESDKKDERSADEAVEIGLAAYYEGQWKMARDHFLEALRKDPAKADTVRKYLALVNEGARTGKRPINLRLKLERTMIEEIEFRELPVRQAIALLTQKIAGVHEGKFEPNVIFKDPAEEGNVSLSLGDIPASEVLRYIVELSGNQANYEPHAIVISRATPLQKP